MRSQAGRPARRPPGERHDAQRGERRGGVGRRRRGREDVRAGSSSRSARRSGAGPATNPPSAASVFEQVPTRSTSASASTITVGPEHRVRFVEHEQRLLLPRTARRARRRRPRRRPSRTRCRSPRARARPPRSRRSARRWSRSRWRYTAASARARRQPSMIDAWLSSSEQTSTPAVPNVVSTPRFAAKPVGKSAAAFGAASSRRARARARRGSDATRR